ncbi:hypothetical protein M0804_012766 [Polistes exclamans]|nr:hypothetical protein M0804_012766 [Polistes exclamans]
MNTSSSSTDDSDITELMQRILVLEDNEDDKEMTLEIILKDITDIIDELSETIEHFTLRITLLESEKKLSISRNPRNFNEKTDYTPFTLINPGKKRCSTLEEYLYLVPVFDGINKSVEDFNYELKMILYRLSKKEKVTFLRLVHEKKLVGMAKKIIDDCKFKTEEEFFDALFACNANPEIYLNAIINRNKCIQGLDSILDYNIRFLQAQNLVEESIIKNPKLSLEEKKLKLFEEQKSGLTEFIFGLNYDLKIAVNACKPKTLNKAQHVALQLQQL